MVSIALALSIVAADLDYNGVIDGNDMAILLNHWEDAGVGDINDDGETDSADLVMLLSLWHAGWGVHDTGDCGVWYVAPGHVISLGASPFVGYHRLTFLDESGAVLAIDMVNP